MRLFKLVEGYEEEWKEGDGEEEGEEEEKEKEEEEEEEEEDEEEGGEVESEREKMERGCEVVRAEKVILAHELFTPRPRLAFAQRADGVSTTSALRIARTRAKFPCSKQTKLRRRSSGSLG